jgi:hypothetical protein
VKALAVPVRHAAAHGDNLAAGRFDPGCADDDARVRANERQERI